MNVNNSLLSDNSAAGNGANRDDASKGGVNNAGRNEVGSGSNGGALYDDSSSMNVYLCGNAVLNNHAGQGV